MNEKVEPNLRHGECFVSVDVETSGPIPGEYSLLSIGACAISKLRDKQDENVGTSFYCTLKPLSGAGSNPDAMKVAGLSLIDLSQNGEEPSEAMKMLEAWVKSVCGTATPVFVGFNAAFDWSFINYYFHRFLGRNPFGFSALDIKSLYMGMAGGNWSDTKSSRITKALNIESGELSHQALEDAEKQAEIFRTIYRSISKS